MLIITEKLYYVKPLLVKVFKLTNTNKKQQLYTNFIYILNYLPKIGSVLIK